MVRLGLLYQEYQLAILLSQGLVVVDLVQAVAELAVAAGHACLCGAEAV
jgi:hypothetical protein